MAKIRTIIQPLELMVLQVGSLDKLHQDQLKNSSKCKFSGPILDLLNQIWDETQRSVLINPTKILMHAKV